MRLVVESRIYDIMIAVCRSARYPIEHGAGPLFFYRFFSTSTIQPGPQVAREPHQAEQLPIAVPRKETIRYESPRTETSHAVGPRRSSSRVDWPKLYLPLRRREYEPHAFAKRMPSLLTVATFSDVPVRKIMGPKRFSRSLRRAARKSGIHVSNGFCVLCMRRKTLLPCSRFEVSNRQTSLILRPV